jgi:hypothetical protein
MSRAIKDQDAKLGGPINGIAGCLDVVFEFALRHGSDDCRTGDHGHKCESNQNVVHRRLLQWRFLRRARTCEPPLKWKSQVIPTAL